ncbi:MAG: transcription initiation factor IIB [Candidatus Altiarchaeota archaeon]|nr:transcription initiation factor IIB [Candidatus Altiarchaeota archaeon]
MPEKKCTNCGSNRIVSDYVHGENFCKNCGLVLEEKLFDFGPEWRAFDREDVDKRSRTGGLLRYGKLTKGLTTEIDKYDRDIKGKAIPVEKKAKWYRLRRWQKRSRMATSLQRNLSVALPELDRMCSYLNIAMNMKEECARLYRKCAAEGLVKGRSIESMVAAVIYIITRQHHVPVTLEELEEVSGRAKKDIGKSYRKIAQGFDLKIPTAGAIEYVPRLAIKLNASGMTLARATDIVKEATDLSIISGKVPISVAAAAVYLAGHTVGDKNIPQKIKGFPGTTKSTIKERYDELKKYIIDKEGR